jgi:hypothetical protein
MNIVTAVTLGLRVLVFIQEAKKNNLKTDTPAEEVTAITATSELLGAGSGEAKEIVELVNKLDDDFIANLLDGVGGMLELVKIFRKD